MGKNRSSSNSSGSINNDEDNTVNTMEIMEKYRGDLINLFKEGRKIDDEVDNEIMGYGSDWLSLTSKKTNNWFNATLSEEDDGSIYNKYYKKLVQKAEKLFKQIEDETGLEIILGDNQRRIGTVQEPEWTNRAQNYYGNYVEVPLHYYDGFGNHYLKEDYQKKDYIVINPTTSAVTNKVDGMSIKTVNLWVPGKSLTNREITGT